MGNLLFSPSGRIGAAAFQKGALILIVLSFLLGLPAVLGLPEAISTILALVSIIFIWCWIVLWIKRYHDAGKSGWLSLIPIVIFIILMTVFMMTYMGSEFSAMMAAMSDPEALEEVEAAMDAKANSIVPLAISALISAIVAFGFNALIKADPHDNQFGPAS
jgi:uncharacterized membrane protein YhaH (DUF805 family)